MKVVGAFIAFLALWGFETQITLTGIVWLLFGIFLIASQQCIDILGRTVRFIHRSRSREQK